MIANGFPKSGNHALVKACELLGVPAEVNHFPYPHPIPDGEQHVLIKRDPRNVVISWMRMQGKPVTPGMFITYCRRFETKSLADSLAEYEPWLHDPRTFVVRYEDLVASDVEMRRLAAHLGVPYIDGAFEELPGLTKSWNPVRSDFRIIWTPDAATFWNDYGGPSLLARWGYS